MPQWRAARLSPGLLLVVVCAAHLVSSVALVGLHHPLGWDETTYLSQINGHVPAGVFTAPRARGLTLLVAPITAWTDSITAIRLWLVLVSTLLMYAGFRTWLRLLDGRVVVAAAVAFSLLWTTVYYGIAAMPNLYVALTALPAAALTVDQLRNPRRSTLLWLGGVVAAMALVRPSDALCVVLALLAAAVVTRTAPRRRRLVLATVLSAGYAAGVVEWVVEAYVRFGGPVHRLHLAQAEQGGGGLHFSLLAQLHTLAGPTLCRSGCRPSTPLWAMLWWLVAGALVVVGLVLARRRRNWSPLATATAAGLAVGAEYVVGIGYAAPRFLIPAYALLALPVGAGVVGLLDRPAVRPRALAAAAVAVAVVAQGVSQVAILRRWVLPETDHRYGAYQEVAAALRSIDAGRPCVVSGHPAAPPIAFDAHCGSLPRDDPAMLDVVADEGRSVAIYLSQAKVPPPPLQGWTTVRLSTPGLSHPWYAEVDSDGSGGTGQPSTSTSAVASRS